MVQRAAASCLDPIDCGSASGLTLPAYLSVVNGGIPGAILRLAPGGTRLGRGAENTYQLQEECISRYHAIFRPDGNGDTWLTDLASTNGTFLNGRRLSGHTPTKLKDGDRIQLGSSVVVKFLRLDPAEEPLQRTAFERGNRDALTDLYTRAYFLHQAGMLAQLNATRGLGLAILMIDVDHFHRINDSHGYDVGDCVLGDVGKTLRELTRPEDLVARYGGEEFVVALPASTPDQATARGEKFRTNLSSRRIMTRSVPLNITVSVGVAYAPAGRVRSIVRLIVAADRCLSHAKQSGRNQVVFRPDPQAEASETLTSEITLM